MRVGLWFAADPTLIAIGAVGLSVPGAAGVAV